MNVKRCVFLISLFWVALSSFAQELPPIETFTPEVYGAEDQNWAITQDDEGAIYFANNKGLLVYNGALWKLYHTPNSSIIRSVEFIDSKIFTGSHTDFGYWEKDAFGTLLYTSLVAQKGLQLKEDEEFWNILKLEQWILFQSLDRIYIYDTETDTFSIIESNTTITKIHKIDKRIYFQKINQGIFKFESGEEKLISDDWILKDKIVVNIFKKNNQLLFQTKENGFHLLEGNKTSPWSTSLNLALSDFSTYNSIQLKNGDFILGTVSNGIIHVNANREIVSKIDQSTGLGNNTVLSLFEDFKGNVWLGLNHGINNVNFGTTLRVYKDGLGILGTVYESLIDNNILYLGTNQGLFYKDQNSQEPIQFVEGTEGQVWFLDKIKNTVFCGHDNGTFVIKNKTARKISKETGAWQIKEINNNPNLLIQGNYDGLYILERTNSGWQMRNKLDGFDISSRYMEFIDQEHLLVSHEYKGVYQLKLNKDFTEVITYQKTDILKSIKSSLVKYNGKILYGSSEGVFYFDKTNKEFRKDSTLSSLYTKEDYISGKLAVANNKLFVFTNSNIAYAQKGSLSSKLQLALLPLPQSLRQTKEGYENIFYVGKDQYLIGNSTGFIVTGLNSGSDEQYQIRLNQASVHRLNQNEIPLDLSLKKNLNPLENNFKFNFSVTDYSKYLPSFYQFRLIGFNDNWSEWSNSSEAIYENLPYGEFIFEARAKVGDIETENTVRYEFQIAKPWLLRTPAIILYFITGFFLVILFHMLHRIYYKKQRKKLLKQKEKELEIKQLENEQQVMYFKNLDLQKDIETKNRELGVSAMNLVKRNELLGIIKKELTATKQIDDVSKVIKLINKNLNTTDDWKIFEEAFNNADKGFIKKLKIKHPNLTSNDLRLCTYLRLNLSSKEIAPLLNISLRSVEVKRYRLRKKINLPHEASLSNYILGL